MVTVFGMVALIGAISILFGWNNVRSGRIDHDDAAAQSQLLANFRSTGRIFMKLGQGLLLFGLIGMAISALFLILT
jgi:hypothetical protein